MNRNRLKTYASQARRDFIAAVTDRAARLGIAANKGKLHVEPIQEQGDVALIQGQPYPRKVAAQRRRLEQRIRLHGFEQVMEAMAYTWFNRLVAIRFMEVNGYLDHGYRVLSHPTGKGVLEILEQAEHVELPGLDRGWVIDCKLAGNRDEALYRRLLIGQCNALSEAMPFLFERIDDETELLLPDNLLHSDSLIRKLVAAVPEEDWREIEIVGWLYQFYISEKKDQVIGKVVASEDIPAATQLFTPNWIVKYLLQNSLGRQWLATYPDSALKNRMAYYIEPAEQTEEVQRQLAAITPQNLGPEAITVLDPACGSGHILVEAYDLMKAIYQERGYRSRDIPALILARNLYGLDIDDRAAQLAAFALMMKARADDRRIFERGVKPNVLAIQESKGLDGAELARRLCPEQEDSPSPFAATDLFPDSVPQLALAPARTAKAEGETAQAVAELLALFEHGKTFGSLITVPESLKHRLPALWERVEAALQGDMLIREAAETLLSFVRQALYLAAEYDVVVANPPYMGSRYYDAALKRLVEAHYKPAKGDLYTCFMARNTHFAKPGGSVGMITIPNWMFLSTFEELRGWLFEEAAIETFCHNGRGVFGSDFGSCAFTIRHQALANYKGRYKRLFEKQGSVASNEELDERFGGASPFEASTSDFRKIPGSPVAYWISDKIRNIFANSQSMGEMVDARQGLATADNDRFLRLWYEVDCLRMGFHMTSRDEAKISGRKWFPHQKGGDFRKWYGNHEWVVNWENDGEELFDFRPRSVIRNPNYYFRECVSWSDITVAENAFRYCPAGFINGHTSHSIFGFDERTRRIVLSFCNNRFASQIIKSISPTVHFDIGYFKRLPFPRLIESTDLAFINELVSIAKDDWNAFETSWDFQSFPWLTAPLKVDTAEHSWRNWEAHCRAQIARMQELETENNRLFIEAYGLQDELTPEMPEDQITLARPDREADVRRLISYAIGCMMGRYSLERPGLVYAHSGNKDFENIYYATQTADTTHPLLPSQSSPVETDEGRYWKSPPYEGGDLEEVNSRQFIDPSPPPPSLPLAKGEEQSTNAVKGEGAFVPDADGIIPITEIDWFQDDIAHRLVEFLRATWGAEKLAESLKFVADSLDPKRGETPSETIRRYLAGRFYKDHLQTYKRRPIYWLFTSGKQGAFQTLVYLHRYHEGTLARMRMEYVIPLQGRIGARIEHLDGDIAAAGSTATRKKLEKERDTLLKQQAELSAFDDRLRHFADRRIGLDLDDGVKVNYGKFSDPEVGELLAEGKAVTGKNE